MDHIRLVNERRDRLLAAQVDAERQLIHRLNSDYVAGVVSLDDLITIYYDYRDVAAPGFSARWNEAAEVKSSRITTFAHDAKRRRPNGPCGTWRGDYPLSPHEPAPVDGTSVVYILFDAANTPCYVGSSGHFRARLRKNGANKTFTTWQAFPCADREAAYELEVRLLEERKPYLNKKVGR
jgi:hypothetical protein